jgi:HD superfamily phosphohydrolase
MKNQLQDSLTHDPVHGYIPFVSHVEFPDREIPERTLIDHPWVQRMRQIHQLQTAWWVYPTAEHTRFQHIIGAMHLASRAIDGLYDSLQAVCPNVPSRGYVECLMRMAALLHDVGHGPFGHFFDEHYLRQFGLTHEILGAKIIVDELGELLRGVRRCPGSQLEPGEELDPAQMAFVITRPRSEDTAGHPRWLAMLRSLFCGIYTVDNMDFVLRDAFMSGYSAQAYDLHRLLHYSFFSERGLTIHGRGVDSVVRFIRVRGELFRAIYFHRTVRAIDLTLSDLFAASSQVLFPGNPLDYLDEYLNFTEWSLLVDVARWHASDNPVRRELGPRWQDLLERKVSWRAVCERNIVFSAGENEAASIFSDAETVERRVRGQLPTTLADLPLRVDLPRHIGRPNSRGSAGGQNFLFDAAKEEIRPLTDDQLFRQLPLAGRTCRIYAQPGIEPHIAGLIAKALDDLIGAAGIDDLTNM